MWNRTETAWNLAFTVFISPVVWDLAFGRNPSGGNNAISRKLSKPAWKWRVRRKSIFSFWTLACQTNVISYAVSVTKWFYRQIEFMASQNLKLFYVLFKAINDLVDSTDSTEKLKVNPSRLGFSKGKDHVVVASTLARAFNTPMEFRRKRV